MTVDTTARPRRFDLIAFDWDGTLFDSTALITRSIQAACRDLGLAVPTQRDASYVIGLSLAEALRHAAPDCPPDRYPELARRYQAHYLGDQHTITLFDGVMDLMGALRARQQWIAVATGKSRRGLDEALRLSGLNEWVDASRTADETASKPHPQMLLELMREFGVEPHRTLMIGDTTHDLQMAAHAGIASVGVSYGAHLADSFVAHAPLFVAHSIPELQDWLLAHG